MAGQIADFADQILAKSDRNGKDDIYTVNAEVLKAELVLADPKKNLGFSSYSPDGRFILYQAELEDKSTELSIYDTATNQTRVIRKSVLGDGAPAWSPDGEWIAFQSRQETNTEICVIKPDGSGFRNLTNHPARDLSPTWSPDGKQIAFTSNRGPSTQVFQLFVMNADGTDQRQRYSSSGSVSTPGWSPNGGIYFADDKEDNRTGNFEIFSIPDGSDEPPKRLTFRKRQDVSPAPAPRTKSLAFVSELDGNSEIYWMYYTGSSLVRLSRNAASDASHHWSPDGRRIIFSSNRGGKFALYEISLDFFANNQARLKTLPILLVMCSKLSQPDDYCVNSVDWGKSRYWVHVRCYREDSLFPKRIHYAKKVTRALNLE